MNLSLEISTIVVVFEVLVHLRNQEIHQTVLKEEFRNL